VETFTVLKSNAIPWRVPNIDTDIITPMKRMLNNYDKLADFAFEPYRFIGGDGDKGQPDPQFPLNREEYKGSRIMVVGENFGSGSSRETAPEAIAKLGIRCLIGTSFGGIFFKNCFQQGILPIVLSEEKAAKLAGLNAQELLEVDLPDQMIRCPDGEEIPFHVEPLRKEALVKGLDDVGMTLTRIEEIEAFEVRDRETRPWVYNAV